MISFEATMQHSEQSFEKLSRMQYDLFCKSNRMVRTALFLGFVLLGLAFSESWWGILSIAYGCYLLTSTYASANHTARKLAKQIQESGMEFPGSRFCFTEEGLEIHDLKEEDGEPQVLPYSGILRLGEDWEYFYMFRDQYGGYMIPKAELGEREYDFRKFMREKTGMTFRMRTSPLAAMMDKMKARKNEPWHL